MQPFHNNMNRPDSKNVSTSSHYHRVLTQDEIMREGLAGRRRRPVLDVINNGTDTGCGVVAKEAIPKGSYVCEYKTSAVYPAREKDKVHECNDAGSYVVETFYSILKVESSVLMLQSTQAGISTTLDGVETFDQPAIFDSGEVADRVCCYS